MEAEFPSEDGQPRCRLCGQDSDSHKVFEPEIPVAAAEQPCQGNPDADFGFIPTTASHQPRHLRRPAGRLLPRATIGGCRHAGLKEAEAPPDRRRRRSSPRSTGKTLLTAPANVFTTEREKALHANEHFLWMQGRFVGAEKANRNGAFWTTEDLELGELTVRHGPLNWLHEGRHIIGTIADTRMVVREEAADRDLAQPHISALSAIWKWIYPDEAWVVEQASDAGKLWYSMECVSQGGRLRR